MPEAPKKEQAPRFRFWLGAVLIVAATTMLLYIPLYRWPVGVVSVEAASDTPLKLHEAQLVRVRTNQPFGVSMRRHINLELRSPALEVKSVKPVQDGERLAFDVEVVPVAPIADQRVQATLRGSFGAKEEASLALHATMPPFYRTDGVTFIEMIKSPPEDIYGSEITMWSAGRRVTVAGHANSVICRRVSSSVWRLGLVADQDDADFFIGAGFACIPPQLSEADLQKHVDEFKNAHPTVWNAFWEVERREHGIGWFANLGFGQELRDSVIREPRRLREHLTMFISQTHSDLIEPEPTSLKQYGDWVSGRLPIDAQVAFIRRFAVAPGLASDLHLSAMRLDSPVRAAAAALPAAQLLEAQRAALALLDIVTSDAEARRDLHETENQTGLLISVPEHHSTIGTDSAEAIRNAVANFARNASSRRKAVFLSELAGGHRGLLPLPFYDALGNRVSFTLPISTLAAGTTGIEEFLSESLQSDMADAARRTVMRAKEAENGALERVSEIAKRNDLAGWLRASQKYEMHDVDDRLRPTGEIVEKTLTGSEFLKDRIQNASAFRRTAEAYSALATSLEQSQDNPRFKHMIRQAAIDSFLRGWELSFVDSALESKFRSWIQDRRDVVWEQLCDQARRAGIDARGLIAESTIFVIRTDPANHEELIIEPRCVADVATFLVRFDKQLGTTIYISDWEARRPEPLTAEEVSRYGLQTGGTSKLAAAARDSLDLILEDLYAAETVVGLPEVEPVALSRLQERLDVAFALDPAGTSRALVLKVMEYLPAPVPVDPKWLEHARLLELAKNDEAASRKINELLRSDDWTFADQYLYHVRWLDQENAKDPQANEVREHLSAVARRIDPQFARRVEADPTALARPSERLAAANDALFLERFKNTLRVARVLNSAKHELDTPDVAGESVISRLSGARLALTDADQASTVSVRAGIKEIIDDVRAKGARTDSIDRFQWKSAIENLIQELVQPAVDELRMSYIKRPTSGALRGLIELQWACGDAAAALNLLLDGVEREVVEATSIERYRRLEQLVRTAEKPVIKGLVYTGQHYLIQDLFGRSQTDYVLVPSKVEEVVPRLKFEDPNRPLPSDAPAEIRDLLQGGADPLELRGRKLRDGATIKEVAKGYTSTTAFILEEGLAGGEVVKVMPRTDDAIRASQAAIDVANHLQRKGVPVAVPLPAGIGRMVDVSGDFVVTRETVAPGVSLASKRQRGQLPNRYLDQFIRANLDIFEKGGDIPVGMLAKAPVTDSVEMLRQVLRRNQEARVNAGRYAIAESQALLQVDSSVGDAVRGFHDQLHAWALEAWPRNARVMIEAVGLVHDGHAGNFFIHEAGMTAIDFGSDYIGPLGHTLAIVVREARPSDGWTYATFTESVDALIAEYERTAGKKLSREGELQVLRAMAVPPYRFISSDSREFFERLDQQLESITGSDIEAKLQTSQGRAILESMLGETEAAGKYLQEMEQLDMTLQLLRNRTNKSSEREKIDRLLKSIDVVRRFGARVAILDVSELFYSTDEQVVAARET